MKAVHGAHLLNVERLAGGHRPGGVHEEQAADAIARGERLRDGAAEVAGADDGHGQHAGGLYSTGMLDGKVALVTGGSRGIGFAIAHALRQGQRVGGRSPGPTRLAGLNAARQKLGPRRARRCAWTCATTLRSKQA